MRSLFRSEEVCVCMCVINHMGSNTLSIYLIDQTYYLSFSASLLSFSLITFLFLLLLLCRTSIRCLSLTRSLFLYVCATATSLRCTPTPSRSWEVTQFPKIQCGCFCCVVAVLRGPLMPSVTALWIRAREWQSIRQTGWKMGRMSGDREGTVG